MTRRKPEADWWDPTPSESAAEYAARVTGPEAWSHSRDAGGRGGGRVSLGPDLHDLGNARWLVAQHGADLRYVRPWRRWLAWDGRRWAPDATGEAERRAQQIVAALLRAAADAPDETRQRQLIAHAQRSASAPRMDSLLKLASTQAELAATPETFNADPWLFNTLTGTLDLRTGALCPHD